MQKILFRCDSSKQIGSGHIMRCLNIAKELEKRGCEITFICRENDEDLTKLIESKYTLIKLPKLIYNSDKVLSNSFLGCDESIDSIDTVNSIIKADIKVFNWLVIDHYGISHIWQEIFKSEYAKSNGKSNEFKILVIDDLFDRKHICDILVDQNFLKNEDRYNNLVPNNCLKLIGPKYAILGDEYVKKNKKSIKRDNINRILIFFGGADKHNITKFVIDCIRDKKYNKLIFEVVIGSQNSNRNKINSEIKNIKNINLYKSLPSLAPLIEKSDFAIGACGSVIWERICLGLPSLVITFGKDQLPIAKALHEEKYIYFLGEYKNITKIDFDKAFEKCILERNSFNKSRNLVDGLGKRRIVNAIFGTN